MQHYDSNRIGTGKEYIGDTGSDSRRGRNSDSHRSYAWPGNCDTERIRACPYCYLRSYEREKSFWQINKVTIFI